MNNEEKAKALEDVLEFALRTNTVSCHHRGLCGYVSCAADKGIIADEDKVAVYALIRDLMNSVNQSIQSKHHNSDFSAGYLISALHIKHDIPFDDDKRLQEAWVEEYRDFIAQLRQDNKPHLQGIKSGDRVWSVMYGWGTVSLRHTDQPYPVVVNFDSGFSHSFTLCGRLITSDINPTIYWDEIQFEAPERPKPKLPHLEVDTKVLVRTAEDKPWTKRYFHSFNDEGKLCTWIGGATQYSATNPDFFTAWNYWKLPDEE